MRTLDGQAAIVTGAARGIGRAIAEVLAAEGAHVAIVDRDADSAEEAAREMREAGHHALGVAADVVDRSDTMHMVEAVRAWAGRVDVLVANAGIYPQGHVEDVEDETWDRVMAVNVKGAFHAVQACLPPMRERGYGRIVLTSSITGPVTGIPGFAHYGASKAALLGFLRSAALETASDGITMNAVLPGNVRTPGLDEAGDEHKRQMLAGIPVGHFGEPEDIGWAVRFLASPEARFITGQSLIVDGGQVLPE